MMSPEKREQIEADFTFRRIVELELDPVRGNFDAAHLKEINRRMFQDLPGAGFSDVTPGVFRPPVEEGRDWLKNRGLSTAAGAFYVAYSRMDQSALQRLDRVLTGANPAVLGRLKPDEFTERLSKLYTELDYVHPFADGNSRTLRTFTRQLARESGYDLDWQRFNKSPVGRDLLYIARDRGVNELARPHLQDEETLWKITHTQDRLEGNRDLSGLLNGAIRPLRAIAFEQVIAARLPEADAIDAHPELKEAFSVLHAAAAFFKAERPGDRGAQDAGVAKVAAHLVQRLDAGETRNFQFDRAARLNDRQPQVERGASSAPDRGFER